MRRDFGSCPLVSILLVALLALASCGGGDDGGLDLGSGGADNDSSAPEPDPDPEPDPGPDDDPVDDPALTAGTCFDRADDEERNVVDSEPVPCDAPHDAELLATFDPPTKNIPLELAETNADLFPPCVELAEEALGFPIAGSRVGLAYVADGTPGGPYRGDVKCFATAPVEGGLIAPLSSGAIGEVTGDYVMLADLTLGNCFTLSEDTSAGFAAACEESGALGSLGGFEAPDGPFPGADALRTLRDEECAKIFASVSDSTAGVKISGTPPSQLAWDFFGFRTVTCDFGPG